MFDDIFTCAVGMDLKERIQISEEKLVLDCTFYNAELASCSCIQSLEMHAKMACLPSAARLDHFYSVQFFLYSQFNIKAPDKNE